MGILIVNGHVDHHLLKQILAEEEYHPVYEASTLAEGHQLLKDHYKQIDLILADDSILDPTKSFEAIKILTSNKKFKKIPLIVLSDSDDLNYIEAAFDAGIKYFVNKPFRPPVLCAQIKSALQYNKSQKQLREKEQQIEHDLRLARKLQLSLCTPPIITDQIEISATYYPSEIISGDLYSWFQIDENRYAVILIDVMGHGLSSALVGMSIRSLLKGMIQRLADPELVVSELNRHIYNLYEDVDELVSYYICCMYAVIDLSQKTIEYVNAGMPVGVLYRNNEEPILLNTRTPVIGIFPTIPIQKAVIPFDLNSCNRLFIYTDGLVDKIGTSKQLIDKLAPTNQEENEQFLKRLTTDYDLSSKLKDDICVISIKINAEN